MFFTIIRHPGERADPSPEGPRTPSRSSAPVLSPASHRAAVWEGRGATAGPLDAEWSSGDAAFLCVLYYNKNIFKDPFGHHVHYREALYIKDIVGLIHKDHIINEI